MNKNTSTITIIVAVYNGENTIQRCIDSVVNQTYPYKELIIMDGASTDGTIPILKKNTPQIKYWHSRKDRGIAHAWNKALEHTLGDWILFLGADDRLQDDYVLSDMADILGNSIETIIYGETAFEGGSVHGLVVGDFFDISVMKRRMVIPHTAAFHRRVFFDEVGEFDEAFRVALDYEFLLRKKELSARFVARRITVMGGEGMSSRLIKEALLEGRAAQIKNKVDWRIKIEVWHAFYQFRHKLALWQAKGFNR